MWHSMLGDVLQDAIFFELLLCIDQELFAEAAERPCPHCGGALHRSSYQRKPRGAVDGLPEEFWCRFSLCCSTDGCRRRLTPLSVRYLGRRVYVAAAVVLVAAAHQGAAGSRIARLSQLLGPSRRTIGRWLSWWCTRFAQSRLFRSLRGLLPSVCDSAQLPTALLDALLPQARTPGRATERLLQLLLPLTSATAPGAQTI